MNRAPSQDTRHDARDVENVVASELRWIGLVVFVLATLLGVIVATSYTHMLEPPSGEPGVASDSLHVAGEFVESNLGTQVLADGRVVVRLVATRFTFVPACVPVPAGRPFALRVATTDVVHGLLVEGTNVNTMIVPGEVSEVRAVVPDTGIHRMPCHEYCGLGHSQMVGFLWARGEGEWRRATPDERRRCSRTGAGRAVATLAGRAP